MIVLTRFPTLDTVQPAASKRCAACDASPLIVVLFRTTNGTCWACCSDIVDDPAVIGTTSLGVREPLGERECDAGRDAALDEVLEEAAAGAGPLRGLRMAKIATASTTRPRTASAMPARRSRFRRRACWRANRPCFAFSG